jgi:hypothetical protein
MKWQSGCTKAMADNTPPPMPPPDLDLMKMMEQSNTDTPPPSITSMTSAEKITATPFSDDSDMFDSPTVRDEYKQLCEDHANLIEMGASYSNFDPSGKIAYIDEIERLMVDGKYSLRDSRSWANSTRSFLGSVTPFSPAWV